MLLFCSKCEKPVVNPDKEEAVDGYLLSCPECDGAIALVPYSEYVDTFQNALLTAILGIAPGEEAENSDCAICKSACENCKDANLFTPDEALYLLHITDKQLGKVNNAANQLINIKTKLGGYTHD